MVTISAFLNVWNSVWPYLVAIALFLVLIIIHEFGHFIAAKLLGVKVNEFAVGFGPKLFSKQGKETKYSVNLIPLGGYCAMEGEDEDSGDNRAFCNKKPWRRFIIIAMGAIFNLILGLVIVAITLAPQEAFNSTVVAEFKENAVSSESGLMVNDKITEVEGRKIFSTYDLSYAFTNVKDGKIDIYDQSPIGGTQDPEIVYGFGLNLAWKGFDFGVLFQGTGRMWRLMSANIIPGYDTGGYYNVFSNYEDRWTVDNPSQDVFYPRLTYGPNTKKNMSYLRLKNIELGWSIPQRWADRSFLSGARVFLRGTNVLTFSGFKLWDPELNSADGGRYPLMRSFSAGVEFKF